MALSKEDVVPVPDRIEGILAVIKDAGLEADATAYANLPYHTDCGFGACHTTCPCVLVGVQLDAMRESSSQLHMMAGSWGKAYHNVPDHITPERYPERRRTRYIQHYSPRAAELIGPYQGYNQIMPGYGEGDIPNIDEVQARQGEAAP